MERPAKVSYEFVKLIPTEKILFGDNVLAMMAEHAGVFPIPDVPLSTLDIANEHLRSKTQEALNGDREKILERDGAEQVWIGLFRQQAGYVQRIAGNSKLIITQSGYQSTSTEANAVARPIQPNFDAWGNKAKGSIRAEIKEPIHARGHVFVASGHPINAKDLKMKNGQLTVPPELSSSIELIFTTKRKVDFEGLVSGQTYYVAALGFNAGGVSPISTIIDVVAP